MIAPARFLNCSIDHPLCRLTNLALCDIEVVHESVLRDATVVATVAVMPIAEARCRPSHTHVFALAKGWASIEKRAGYVQAVSTGDGGSL
jgi:hypothetical protein